MDGGDELLFRVAFARYRSLSIDIAERFDMHGISPEDFFTRRAAYLAQNTGIRPDFFSDSRRENALRLAREELKFISDNHITPLFYTDAGYPARLRGCNDAPVMLYTLGNTAPLAAEHTVAVVGTRHCTAYGADFTRRLITDLARKLDSITVISGLAYGVDICAHRAALDAGIPTGAVFAHGLNTVYPADHRNDARRIVSEGGVLATEYLSSSAIHRGNFLARNRIVAGLCDVTVVVESDIRGGAMSTARIAAEYGRDVMALPGRVSDPYSRGTNELIAANTATIIRDADDLIALMRWSTKAADGQQQELCFDRPPEYEPVLKYLREHSDASANELCVALDMPFADLSALLFRMELDDCVVALPGSRYTLPAK